MKEAGVKAKAKFGSVTLLINNAGIVDRHALKDKSDFMIQKTLEVNTLGVLYGIREFLPDMYRNNKGHIVTIASLAGHVGVNNAPEYSASKGGAVMIDESIRTQIKFHKKNIRTTCICPFFINTGMFEGARRVLMANILDE